MFDGIANTLLQPQYAIDGVLTTRYSTGQDQMGTEWFQVDLCRDVYVAGVTLNDSNGTDSMDVATAYNVQVSLDGQTWSTMAMSATPAAVDLVVTFTPKLARFVRFNQTGVSATRWWSIDEFTVACGAADGGP
jgi:F5/8 type C domain-containing protein